jgi:hypothetical protein
MRTKDITARNTGGFGIGVGGGPQTLMAGGRYVISGVVCVDGPAAVIGRDVLIELTENEVDTLIHALRRQQYKMNTAKPS